MANMLVTGGAGFIGGNFVRYWADRYPDDPMTVLDSLICAGNGSTLAGIKQADLIVGDIRDTALLQMLLPKAPAANGQETRSLIRFVTDRPGHDRRYAIDDLKARTLLGYEPKHEFSISLQKTLEWYLENEAWWRPLVSR